MTRWTGGLRVVRVAVATSALLSLWSAVGGCAAGPEPVAAAGGDGPKGEAAMVGTAPLACAPAAAQRPTVVTVDPPPNVTSDQVVVWVTQGTRDDVVIDRIERSRAVFRLSSADEQRLRQQGVSGDVIVAMKESCWR